MFLHFQLIFTTILSVHFVFSQNGDHCCPRVYMLNCDKSKTIGLFCLDCTTPSGNLSCAIDDECDPKNCSQSCKCREIPENSTATHVGNQFRKKLPLKFRLEAQIEKNSENLKSKADCSKDEGRSPGNLALGFVWIITALIIIAVTLQAIGFSILGYRKYVKRFNEVEGSTRREAIVKFSRNLGKSNSENEGGAQENSRAEWI